MLGAEGNGNRDGRSEGYKVPGGVKLSPAEAKVNRSELADRCGSGARVEG